MGSYEQNKPRVLSPHHRTPCTPTHQIFALLLIVITYFITSLSLDQDRSSQKLLRFNGRYLSWPERGFGSHLSLKIYVYDEDEIDGLDTLMYGTGLNLTAEDCDKGQWGTQVKIHKLLLQSRFRTSNKEEADLFFVPAYVKCIMVKAGLAEEVINQTYVENDMLESKHAGGVRPSEKLYSSNKKRLSKGKAVLTAQEFSGDKFFYSLTKSLQSRTDLVYPQRKRGCDSKEKEQL
ncbi:hypothetical protein JRO89_XS07G0207300 [Xanthoceras sorbifolium]|uniref:Uncharacterized protein n=1 Tax=Xanthoceras sorbifolium TaxID=99658 RepID=A0ABQ8HUN8_9ROSI|nr:hypothetical protein JRO89_XS07G0207300 [Xanthoceras sorbifolium]